MMGFMIYFVINMRFFKIFKVFLKSGPSLEKSGKIRKNGVKRLAQNPHIYTTHMGRKLCRKIRNCSLRAISPFPTEFSKDLNCGHVKSRARIHQPFSRILFLSFSPRFCKRECNITSDWLNHTVYCGQSKAVLHSNAARYRKN